MTKRVAENASQKRCTDHQRSRAFSATHFTDENSQLLGFTGKEDRSLINVRSITQSIVYIITNPCFVCSTVEFYLACKVSVVF